MLQASRASVRVESGIVSSAEWLVGANGDETKSVRIGCSLPTLGAWERENHCMSPIFHIVLSTSTRQVSLPKLRQLEVAQGTVWQMHLVGVVLVMHGESIAPRARSLATRPPSGLPRYCRCSCKHLSFFSGEETKFSSRSSKPRPLRFESTSRPLAADGPFHRAVNRNVDAS